MLKTKAYLYKDLPVTTNGQNKQRTMFTGKTHTGFKMESHQSDIAPGEVNHPPHQHLREEMMLVRLGTMELTISGKPLTAGSWRCWVHRLERNPQREECGNGPRGVLHRQHRQG